MSADVAIIDSGGANIASLKFALERLGASCELTVDPDRIKSAPRVILPGVGAAADAMEKLETKGLDKLLPKLEKPVLGICLGMQLLMDASEEDDASCLGMISGSASRFEAAPDRPVPHMGWNQLDITCNSRLLDGIADGSYFYFVHSYAVGMLSTTLASSNYGGQFSAIIRQENFMGTQFHPERSGKNGARLLANFLHMHAGDF